MKKNDYDFSIFNNYKCDGQLVMTFSDDKINITEEKDTNKTENEFGKYSL